MTKNLSRGIRLLWPLAVLIAPAAAAHPHAWIELHSAVIFDENRKITALEEQWLLDDVYTAFTVQSLKPDQRTSKPALTELIGKDLARIAPLGYFTEVQVGGKKAELGTVSTFESEMRGKRLWLRFVVPLRRAVDPRTQPFSYWIGDPTYWIEMLHAKAAPIELRGPGATDCHARIDSPHPGPEIIARAVALDVDGKADPTLGRLFAEQITIGCAGSGR